MITEMSIIAAVLRVYASIINLPDDIDKHQIKCLADNIFWEARSQPEIGQLGIAYVTLNRVKSKRYENTICDVVWKKRCAKSQKRKNKYWLNGCTAQFTWTWDGASDNIIFYTNNKLNTAVYKNYKLAIILAIDAVTNDENDPTNGATHYYNPSICYKSSIKYINECHPKWAMSNRFVETARLYEHRFMKYKK